ncbi:uncharacterized protein METZ01_LOCUS431081, partial [marine metagenome]
MNIKNSVIFVFTHIRGVFCLWDD